MDDSIQRAGLNMARDMAPAKHYEGAGIGGGAINGGDPWKHRSAGMQCRTCMWFAHKAPEPAQAMSQGSRRHEVGRCRRHAPTMGGYPVVFVSDWCGDHRLDENRA